MKINNEALEKIYKHGVDEYPEECCGIITGNIHNQTVHPCQNIQNRLHAKDPERYPRDARTAYTVDRSEADRIYSEAKNNGEDILAFYHSHIDCDAFFSETDIAAQTVFGEPEFPEAIHIVISVINRKVQGIKYFKWNRDKGDFVCYS